mmetsp:Transcript_40705/g.122603  ORF Transcript_40705/g.122603 Transcript_40705/m.122603 type:complete len:238 (-) Transcript_40705:368-1081(-)
MAWFLDTAATGAAGAGALLAGAASPPTEAPSATLSARLGPLTPPSALRPWSAASTSGGTSAGGTATGAAAAAAGASTDKVAAEPAALWFSMSPQRDFPALAAALTLAFRSANNLFSEGAATTAGAGAAEAGGSGAAPSSRSFSWNFCSAAASAALTAANFCSCALTMYSDMNFWYDTSFAASSSLDPSGGGGRGAAGAAWTMLVSREDFSSPISLLRDSMIAADFASASLTARSFSS